MNPQAADFLGQRQTLLIGGEWTDAADGGTIEVLDPATAATAGRVAAAGPSDVDRAVEAAGQALRGAAWTGLSPDERGRILWRVAEGLERHREALAWINTLENGKPLTASLNGDVPAAARTFRHYAGMCTKIAGQAPALASSAGAHHAYTRLEPVGVVGQIVPWNGPIVAASWKLAPALAAGCTSVFNPAEETPLTALYLGRILQEAGVPPGVVNIVPGHGETAGAAICAHPGIRKVAFTGSTEVGREIVRAAAGNLKKVSLELGGKSPVIICADADLERAIPAAANAIFFNAGQVCIAGSRLYVEAPVYDEVVRGIARIAAELRVGPGIEPDTQMGPLISSKQLERVAGLVDRGRDEGARVVAGGERVGRDGFFMQPTVLADVEAGMTVMREEIFGPVLCAAPFTDFEQVVAEANDTEYGLAHRLAARIEAGLVWINCHAVADPAITFGGYKQSGWGRENGWDGMMQYFESKSVVASLD